MLHWILLALALGSYLLYAWAIRYGFSREGGVDLRMRLLQTAGLAAAIVHGLALWHHTQQPLASGLCALALYLLALLVFFASRRAARSVYLSLAFSSDIPVMLLDKGIYARIRHPFYTAYMLTWLGGAVAAPSPWTIAAAATMFSLYLWASIIEERKFRQSSLAAHYQAYCSGAGRFWPR